MTIIDHSSIKRVSQDDGLESITLRSDLAARYIFLNETLLEGIGAVKVDDKFRTMLGLKEIIKDENNNPITDETEYLRKWKATLEKEVAQLEQQPSAITPSAEEDQLVSLIRRLDQPMETAHLSAETLDDPETALAPFDALCAEHVTAMKSD